MTISSLWCSLAILPSHPATPKTSQPESSSWDLSTQVPGWERHPRQRSGHGAGTLDTEWIRRHLP